MKISTQMGTTSGRLWTNACAASTSAAKGAPLTLSEVSMSFFFNDTAPTEIYTLSLHDALPIPAAQPRFQMFRRPTQLASYSIPRLDRKSTRLNSSHPSISYAVFCLKKKKKSKQRPPQLRIEKWAEFASR